MAPRRIRWWVLSLVCFYAAEKRRLGWSAWAHEVGPGLAPGASCPGLVYPPSGVVLGADDALHLTVADQQTSQLQTSECTQAVGSRAETALAASFVFLSLVNFREHEFSILSCTYEQSDHRSQRAGTAT